MLAAQVEQWFPAYGIKHEILTVDMPTGDFSPQIARIAAMDMAPDAIFLSVNGGSTLALQRQLLDVSIGPQSGTLLVSGRQALDGTQFWSTIPDGALTIISRRGAVPANLNEMGNGFWNRYIQATDQWPNAAAFGGYDSIQLLVEAARRAATLSGSDLVAELERTDTYLAGGEYAFPVNSTDPPDGETTPSWMWHQQAEPSLLFLQYREALQTPETIDIVWPSRYRTAETLFVPQP